MINFVTVGCQHVIPAVLFQADGVPSNESFVRARSSLPRLDAMTFCVHFYLHHVRDALLPLASYSVPEFSEEFALCKYNFF